MTMPEEIWKEDAAGLTYPYILKSTVDAQRAELKEEAANMKHDIERMTQINADMATEIVESDKTKAALSFALEIIVEQSPDNLAVGTAKQALKEET